MRNAPKLPLNTDAFTRSECHALSLYLAHPERAESGHEMRQCALLQRKGNPRKSAGYDLSHVDLTTLSVCLTEKVYQLITTGKEVIGIPAWLISKAAMPKPIKKKAKNVLRASKPADKS